MRLVALHVYPVKSCRGLSLSEARFGARGLERDRELLVVDAAGRFVTQRERPRLALVEPVPGAPGEGPCAWTLTAPGAPPLRLTTRADGPRVPVRVWDDTAPAVDQGDAAAAWLSALLGLPVRLVRMADEHVRPCDPAWTDRPGARTGFADGFPALLASTASLEALAARRGAPVPMDRFRPNLVVEGAPPWAEDGWSRLRIGEVVLDVVKPCARCAIPSIDQRTAERTREPGATLAAFRTHDGARWPALAGKVLFGQNLVHHGPGTVRVGDEVVVLA